MNISNPEPTKAAVVQFRVTVSVPCNRDRGAKHHRHHAADQLNQKLSRDGNYTFVPNSMSGWPDSDTVRVDFDVTLHQLCDPPSRDSRIISKAKKQISDPHINVHDGSGLIHDRIPI